MPSFVSQIHDRPVVAARKLFQMDPGAAARALISPESLTPRESRTLADNVNLRGPFQA